MRKGENACQPRFLKKWVRQVIDLICLEKELKDSNGILKADCLPGLKKVNPSIECYERFMTTVVYIKSF